MTMEQLSQLSGYGRVDAELLTQNLSVGGSVKLEKSTAFKAAQTVIGIFTAGIGAAVMEVIHHVRTNHAKERLAKAAVDLHNGLKGLPQHEDTTVNLRLIGEPVEIHQKDDNRLTARVDGQEIDLPQTAGQLVDHLESDMMRFGRLFSPTVVADLVGLGETERSSENVRSLCLSYLGANLGITPAEVATTTTPMLRCFVLASHNDPKLSKSEILDFMSTVSNAYRINSEECLELLQRLDEQDAVARDTVSIARVEPEVSAEAKKTTEQDVRDFVADLAFNKETWVVDRHISSKGVISGERLRETLLEHAPTLAAVLEDPALLNAVSEEMRKPVESLLNSVKPLLMNRSPSPAELEATLKILPASVFSEMEGKIEEFVQKGISELQSRIDGEIEKVFSPGVSNSSASSATASAESVASATNPAASSAESATTDAKPVKTAEQAAAESAQLDAMLAAAATDMKSNGYGRFMKEVMQKYFSSLSEVDKRSVMAAGVRYASGNASPGERLGALLKGAGPVMQKMLQGINTTNLDPSFAAALKDMKSNLAPIADKVVEAYMNDIVVRSQGRIQKIEVVKVLGAASVGEALLCKVFSSEKPEGEECVVKLLRPDVQTRAAREYEIFKQVADGIDGMAETFRGQYERISEELDLTLEAEHILEGNKVYQFGDTLTSMKLHPLVDSTASVMVLEKAPGDPLDKFMGGVREKLANLHKDYNLDAPQNGDVKQAGYDEVTERRNELQALYNDTLNRQQHLLDLVTVWVKEGVYGEGFYHGDLHAGNIMTSENKMTVIDFGNATRLTNEQRCQVTRMMAAALVGKSDIFMEGYYELLSEGGKAKFDEHRDQLKETLDRILQMGTGQDTGKRIGVALNEIQKLGIEAPGPIFNFSQCQLRLQAAVDEINALLGQIKSTITQMQRCLSENPLNIMSQGRALTQAGLDAKEFNDSVSALSIRANSEEVHRAVRDAVMASLENENDENYQAYILPMLADFPDIDILRQEIKEAIEKEKVEALQEQAKADEALKSAATEEEKATIMQDKMAADEARKKKCDTFCDLRLKGFENGFTAWVQAQLHVLSNDSTGTVRLRNFCDCMGDVVRENLVTSARRIGLSNISSFSGENISV